MRLKVNSQPFHQIIFLDVDGVLNSTTSCMAFGGFPNVRKPNSWHKMNDVAVRMVRGLSLAANAPIVLSSAWRVGNNTPKFAEYFKLNIIDKTGREGSKRGDEIKAWLERNKHITNYVILDDSIDMLMEQIANFVHVNANDGLTFKDIDIACKILGIKPDDVRKANKPFSKVN